MSKLPSLIFFGTEDFSATILSRLLDAGYDIKAVITKPDAKRGRGKTVQPPQVKTIARQYNIPVLQPETLKNSAEAIGAFGCSYAVLAAYGKIVPTSILDIFSDGIINVHPSLLPTYRGPSPIESAILHGDEKTGVTIMKLAEAMDAGPVYAQKKVPLQGNENRPELYASLTEVGAALLIETLPAIFSGGLSPQPQNDELATYCPLIKKSDGVINWQKSAAEIERGIRAYQGWPGSRTHLFGQDVIILEVKIVDVALAPGEIKVENSQLLVGTAENSLKIKKLRPSGRSSMNSEAFLRGLRV